MEAGSTSDEDMGAVIDTNAFSAVVDPDFIPSPRIFSPSPNKIWELGSAGHLTRVDLDLAYGMEKLLNLDTFLTHVSAKATDYEALYVNNDLVSCDSLEKALEFYLLSSILDSEVRELDHFMSMVEMDFADAHERISMHARPEECSLDLDSKLRESAKSLRQVQDILSDIRTQSSKLQSKIVVCGQEAWSNNVLDTKVKMHTVEQQRYILASLEKSLARELDLEDKLSCFENNKEELLMKLHRKEGEICLLEEITDLSIEKLTEAETVSAIFVNISKGLLDKLYTVQIQLDDSEERAKDLEAKVSLLEQQLKEASLQLEEAESAIEINQTEMAASLSEIYVLRGTITDLNKKILAADDRVENAEGKCRVLEQNNRELNELVVQVKYANKDIESACLLEKCKHLEEQLHQAEAIIEKKQENENVLCSTLDDMQGLTEAMKQKVSEAESRADTAESRCNLFTKTDMEKNEEIAVLRGRIRCLERSLMQAEDGKKATASEIQVQTKMITNLIMQLAGERERLQIQLSSLAKGNAILMEKYWKITSQAGFVNNPLSENVKQSNSQAHSHVASKYSESCAEAVVESSAASLQVNSYVKEAPIQANAAGTSIFAEEIELDAVRSIEAVQLNSAHVAMAVLILVVSGLTLYLFQYFGVPLGYL